MVLLVLLFAASYFSSFPSEWHETMFVDHCFNKDDNDERIAEIPEDRCYGSDAATNSTTRTDVYSIASIMSLFNGFYERLRYCVKYDPEFLNYRNVNKKEE